MMKNKAMRIAAGAGVTTLLTMSVISGSFAKYITSGTGTDSARAAKFGVTVTANGTMFASEYAKDDENVVGAIAKSVVSSGGEDDHVVAPGTKGELLNATITGKPEVAVKVSYEPTLTLNGWEYTDERSASSEYFPIIFKVGDKKYGMKGVKDSTGAAIANGSSSIAEWKTAVENAIKGYSKNYAANTDLSGIGADGFVNVSWEWAYNGNSDEKDTYLGDQAAANKASTVELSMKTTVTQID